MKRHVFFGGTFNPIHHGHLIAARAVAEHFGFDRVTFVPAGLPPHKRNGGETERLAPPPDRLEMVRLAVAGEPLFDVSDIEAARPCPSYTLETIREIRRRCDAADRIFWIVGADMLEDLPNWYRASELLREATIVTAARPPRSDRMDAIAATLRKRLGEEPVDALMQWVAATPLVDISSTTIRARVAGGLSVRYLTPDAVIDYIRKRGLYRSGD